MHRPTRARRATRLAAAALTLAGALSPSHTSAAGRPARDAHRAAHPAAHPDGDAAATVETDPVQHGGDAADDPAIWYDRDDPARSMVIGNDKQGALEVYDLQGNRVQRLTGGFFGNVDVRAGVPTGRGVLDLVVAWHGGITVYAMDPRTRRLSNVTDGDGSIAVPTGGEGLCLYRSARSGELFAFVSSRPGRVAQYELHDDDGDGRIDGRLRRGWAMGSETEGCVADDELGHLYISEEGVGIWRYDAAPAAPSGRAARTLVDAVRSKGGRLRADVEGLAMVHGAGGRGYLIASSQAASDTLNSYLVYERGGGNDFVREFRVVDGPSADGCGRTDGIDALSADLGPGFRRGVFICQDNHNSRPDPGAQNFKLVPLERVLDV